MSLLTVVPGRMGGSESYVRALLDQFARGNGPERVTLLANSRVATAYADRASGPVSLHAIRRYRPGVRPFARAAAMLSGYAASGLIARELPAGLQALHFPVTIPIPRTGLPEVVTLHDVQHHDMPEFFGAPERALRRLTYDRAARQAAAVITPSEYSARRIVEVLDLPPDRVETVPSGIDQERFTPTAGSDDSAVVARLGLTRPFLFYPANLWPHKNHERLIRAFASAPGDELDLVLTGRTYGRLTRLAEVAGSLGVGARVRHLGFVDPDEVPTLYRAACAVVFPSLYEGFGGPPLEAMACGCPVAASTRASLAEVCGDATVSFDPESVESIAVAIERVVTDETLRRQLEERGLRRAAGFSWQRSAQAHAAVYRRVALA
jgi:glycosyltransferase involved in cell wall biosynthesis